MQYLSMIWDRNFKNILNGHENFLFNILCYLREGDNNVLELFFLPTEEELSSSKSHPACEVIVNHWHSKSAVTRGNVATR